VLVNAARVIDIDSDASVHVGRIQTSGSLRAEGEYIDTAPAPFHFVTADDPEAQFALRSRATVFIESIDAQESVTVVASPQDPPPDTPPTATPPPEDTGCDGASGGSAGSGSSGSITATSGDGSTSDAPPSNPDSSSQVCSSGPISGGEISGPVEETAPAAAPAPSGETAPAGSPTLAASTDGSGGGAFPGLFLLLLGALRHATRRPRR